jgi:hypothetical protein
MNMPCRITDENVYNPWEEVDPDSKPLMKGLDEVTLYDLMADDNYVWVGRNKGYGYLLELENHESTEPYLREVGLNPCAMESLASFCRRYLSFYDKIEAA